MSNEIIQFQYSLPIEDHNEEPETWIQLFDPLAAVESVFKYVEKLPSSRTTRHTARQYRICLYDFLQFAGAVIWTDQTDKTRMEGDVINFSRMQLHTPQQVEDYIVYSIEQGRSSSTIRKYLAVIRHYIGFLRKQSFIGTRGEIRNVIYDCKELFDLAIDVDAPADETKSSEDKGTRLTKDQVKQYIAGLDRSTLAGKRDAAIFHVMLMSGLRVSEVARITPNSIRQGSNTWEIHVLGKRNNTDAAVIDQAGINLINEWIEAYNASLPEDDKRRIEGDNSIWQPLTLGSHHIKPERMPSKRIKRGLTSDAIRAIIAKHTPDEILAQIKTTIKPHDLRRTLAHNLNEVGVMLTIIQRILRHSNPSTTTRYIGKRINMQPGLLSNYWHDLWTA